jgi:hypothetical protein
MPQSALEISAEQTRSITLTPVAQRDQGLQMRLFPAHAPEVVEQVDLRVADDLAGMYYIG